MISQDELRRLQTVESLDAVDGPPLPALDSLVRVTATTLKAGGAFVSLAASELLVFKSSAGFRFVDRPRAGSFCEHVVTGRRLFAVPDASLDARFRDAPAVIRSPRLRFYAGAPISIDAEVVGALAIVGAEPRHLSDDEQAALGVFADRAAELLIADRRSRETQTLQRALKQPAQDALAEILSAATAGLRAPATVAAREWVRVLQATETLAAIVDDVLSLRPGPPAERAEQDVDVTGLLRDLLREYDQAGSTVTSSIAPGLKVDGDLDRMSELLARVVHLAAESSTPAQLRASCEKDSVVVEVTVSSTLSAQQELRLAAVRAMGRCDGVRVQLRRQREGSILRLCMVRSALTAH